MENTIAISVIAFLAIMTAIKSIIKARRKTLKAPEGYQKKTSPISGEYLMPKQEKK